MTVSLLKAKDNAKGLLNAGIAPSTLSIPLQSGQGALFPQPYTGTATSGGTRTVLNATGIGASGIAVDDFIRNFTDGSWAQVVTVSTNSLTTTRLKGGSTNLWNNGDTYRVNEFSVTLAKIDVNGNDTDSEEVLISNRSTDTLTVPTGGRGYNGTNAQAFDAEDYVQLRVTAPYFEELKKLIKEYQQDTDSTNTTLATLQSDLSSTANAKGASMIGIEDTGSYFGGTTVESALQAIGAALGGVTGSMLMWLTDTAPTGWLLCYGQAVSRTTYAALFGVIGTTFGIGDGSTTFNLPDMRGRFPLGQDDMGGSSANRVTDTEADTIGSTKGTESKTLTTNELPAHTHGIQAGTGTGGSGAIGKNATAVNTSGVTDSAGTGSPFTIMNPYITVNFIIKQ